MNRDIYQSIPNCLKFMSPEGYYSLSELSIWISGILTDKWEYYASPIMTKRFSQAKYDEVSYIKASA